MFGLCVTSSGKRMVAAMARHRVAVFSGMFVRPPAGEYGVKIPKNGLPRRPEKTMTSAPRGTRGVKAERGVKAKNSGGRGTSRLLKAKNVDSCSKQRKVPSKKREVSSKKQTGLSRKPKQESKARKGAPSAKDRKAPSSKDRKSVVPPSKQHGRRKQHVCSKGLRILCCDPKCFCRHVELSAARTPRPKTTSEKKFVVSNRYLGSKANGIQISATREGCAGVVAELARAGDEDAVAGRSTAARPGTAPSPAINKGKPSGKTLVWETVVEGKRISGISAAASSAAGVSEVFALASGKGFIPTQINGVGIVFAEATDRSQSEKKRIDRAYRISIGIAEDSLDSKKTPADVLSPFFYLNHHKIQDARKLMHTYSVNFPSRRGGGGGGLLVGRGVPTMEEKMRLLGAYGTLKLSSVAPAGEDVARVLAGRGKSDRRGPRGGRVGGATTHKFPRIRTLENVRRLDFRPSPSQVEQAGGPPPSSLFDQKAAPKSALRKIEKKGSRIVHRLTTTNHLPDVRELVSADESTHTHPTWYAAPRISAGVDVVPKRKWRADPNLRRTNYEHEYPNSYWTYTSDSNAETSDLVSTDNEYTEIEYYFEEVPSDLEDDFQLSDPEGTAPDPKRPEKDRQFHRLTVQGANDKWSVDHAFEPPAGSSGQKGAGRRITKNQEMNKDGGGNGGGAGAVVSENAVSAKWRRRRRFLHPVQSLQLQKRKAPMTLHLAYDEREHLQPDGKRTDIVRRTYPEQVRATYKVGDRVEVRNWEEDHWQLGDVKEVLPALKVRLDGYDKAHLFRFTDCE